jgi:hypothetical protein
VLLRFYLALLLSSKRRSLPSLLRWIFPLHAAG